MHTRAIRAAQFSPLLVVLAGGCATKALWDNGRLEAWKQPADALNLSLFLPNPPTDLLVRYNEFSERNDSVHPRAYWVNQNEKALEEGRAPHFTRPGSTAGLTVVPVFYGPIPFGACLPGGWSAAVSTNKQSFRLYHGGQLVARHDLPVYNDGKGGIEKAAMTPIAVTADLTIVGGVVGWFMLEGWADSPVPWGRGF